jgi:hypothetical protein
MELEGLRTPDLLDAIQARGAAAGNASCGSGGGYWATGYYQNYAEDMGLHQWTGPLPGLTPRRSSTASSTGGTAECRC